MYVTWNVCLVLLLILSLVICVVYNQGWVQNMYSVFLYVVYTHTALVYWAVIVVWYIICVVCVVCNAEVAHAGGETNIFEYLFKTYHYYGLRPKTVVYNLHEKQQHAFHMAGFHFSTLPSKGYYYLTLANTGVSHNGDALLFNTATNHGLLLQHKAAVQATCDWNKMSNWLKEYAANTQLLCYGVYDQQAYNLVATDNFNMLREKGKAHIDCVVYLMNLPCSERLAMDLEEGMLVNLTVLSETMWTQYLAAYRASVLHNELISDEALTNEQVIDAFTHGLRVVVGKSSVARLCEE